MRMHVVLIALMVVACGGASATELDSVGPDGTPASPNGADPVPADPGTVTPPPPAPTSPGPPACTPTTYYKDDDGDGFGGTKTTSSCTPPAGRWSTKGGDCDDSSSDVFPGQTAYFDEPYVDGTGRSSFDYDCTATEDQEPPPRKAAGTCAFGLTNGTCKGEGFLPPALGRPPSAGSDPLCGAVRYQSCKFVPGGSGSGGASCQASIVNDVKPTSCR